MDGITLAQNLSTLLQGKPVQFSPFIVALQSTLTRNEKILVGVSGGKDSMALLYGLCSLRDRYRLEVHVAHVNHNIRPTSTADQQFVAEVSKSLSCPFYEKTLTSCPVGENFEGWARQERYEWFRSLRSSHALDWIATAHHAQDVVETFLIKLLQNKEFRLISRKDEKRKIWRPLLGVHQEVIIEFLEKNALPFRNDPTNFDTMYLRNRVRHDLLPELQKAAKGDIVTILSNRCQSLEEDLRFLDAQGDASYLRLVPIQFESKKWCRRLTSELLCLPPVLRWRVIEKIFLEKVCFRLGRKHSTRVVEFVLGNSEGLQIPGGITIERSGGALEVRKGSR